MKKLFSSALILIVIFCTKDLCSREVGGLSKYYETVSMSYPVPDNDKKNFPDVDFRFGWNSKAPFRIAVQFVNRGYKDRKLKFAIKDVTSKKMIVLDGTHRSRFGSEMLKADSMGAIWSGPVDNIKDGFSLCVWNGNGDKFVKAAVSISDQ